MSSARLAPYRLGGGEPNEVLVGRYLWNMAIIEALHPTLNMVEVLLRNSFYGGIAMLAGPAWFDNHRVLVNEHAQEEVAEAKQRLLAGGRVTTPPDVIAALDFGFWTGLTNREYEQGPGRPPEQIPLWPTLLDLIRTGLPPRLRTRTALSEFLGRVRIIRNRAFHCEPLWLGHPDRQGKRVPLSVDHAEMCELIRTMAPRVADVHDLLDRFPYEFDRGPGPWIEAVRKLCVDRGHAA